MEILDLVDKKDKVIGTQTLDYIYKNHLNNYRVVNILIYTENKILVPLRNSNRFIFPN